MDTSNIQYSLKLILNLHSLVAKLGRLLRILKAIGYTYIACASWQEILRPTGAANLAYLDL